MEVNHFLLLRFSTWGKFAWMGAIIFERNFMVRGQFSGGMGGNFPREQLFSGVIVQGQLSVGRE